MAPEGYKFIKTFVGSQSYDQGYSVGKMMVARLGKNANVIFIGGKAGTDDVNGVQGAKDAWKDGGVSYKVLADQPAEWSQDKSLAVMQDLLTRFPKGINAVYAVDDPMALGALKAITAAGREKDIAVYGTNGTRSLQGHQGRYHGRNRAADELPGRGVHRSRRIRHQDGPHCAG